MNVQNFLNLYQDQLHINLIIYPSSEKNTLNISSLSSEIEKISSVKKIVVIPPEELIEKEYLSSEFLKTFSQEEIKSYFPYILKIYPSSVKDYSLLKDHLSLLAKTNPDIEISEHKIFKLISLASFLKAGFLILIIIWMLFYLIFLYLINKFLNTYLKSQTQIFLLLGGTLRSFKFLRFLFVGLILLIAFGISFLLFFYVSQYVLSIFIFFKPYPNLSKILHLLLLGVYAFFVVAILPWLAIWMSYKGYEI